MASSAPSPSCLGMADIYVSMRAGSIQQAVRPGAERRVVKPVLLMITVNGDGLIRSIRAHWEPGRAIATLTTLIPNSALSGMSFGGFGPVA